MNVPVSNKSHKFMLYEINTILKKKKIVGDFLKELKKKISKLILTEPY